MIERLIVFLYFKDCAGSGDPTGYTSLASTLFGETPTGSCDTGNGYDGTASITSSACTTGGTWDSGEFSGCTLVGMSLLML